MQRGQTVLEFLFLLLVIIVYLTTAVIPMAKNGQELVSDTENIAKANNEAQKLSLAIGQVSMLGENSRQTIDLFIPRNTTISCNTASNSINFIAQVKAKPFPAQCPAGECTKFFNAPNGVSLNCLMLPTAGPQKATIKIEKTTASQITVSGS